MNYSLIELPVRTTDGLGSLSFLEAEYDTPFPINRIYYIYDVPAGTQRGGHAHKRLRQLLFCPNGEIEIMLTDGKEHASVMLDRPNKALLIGPGVWRDMLWHTGGAVLCVAASEHYDEKDYIRDYDAFMQYKNQLKDEPEND